MKFKNLLSLLLISVSVLSCSEDLRMDDVNEDAVSFEVQIPVDNMKTRSYSDASLINTLKCYVYQQDKGANAQPLIVENIPIQNYDTYKGAKYTLQLPKDQKYDLVVIATSCEQENSSGKIYYNRTNRSFNVNYNKFAANDESVDCFLGTIKNVSPGQSSYSVSLKRPFAQLNIGTKDLKDYNDLSASQLNTVGVSIDGVYSSMDVMSGNVTGDKSKVSFPQASVISGNTFPKEGMSYLAMNYLLVNQRENTTVGLRATAANGGYVDMSYADIPLQRNYRTNLFGNLLTKSNDYKVEISPDFTGVENKDVNTDYDLVLKVVDNYAEYSEFRLYYNNQHVDLFPLIDSKGIIKLRWADLEYDDIKTIRFHGMKNKYLDVPIKQIIKLDLTDLNIISVYAMLNGCQSLETINGFNWNTANVTDMHSMFNGCKSLTTLDVSKWNTANVTDMHNMFNGCESLSQLNFSNWNTGNVTDMGWMFSGCKSLTTLDVSKWNTANVTDMGWMFSGCKSLTTLDVSKWNTANVTDMGEMFNGCESLLHLNFSNWDTGNVTNMRFMFSGCKGLSSLDVSNWNTANVTDMHNMFNGCESLSHLNFSNWDTGNVTDMRFMFNQCKGLSSLDVSNWDTGNVTNMGAMFQRCENLATLDVSNWDTGNVTNMGAMFFCCKSLLNQDFSKWNTANVSNMEQMYSFCETFTRLDMPNWNVSNVQNLRCFVSSCKSLEHFNASNWNLSNISTVFEMFYVCPKLRYLDLTNWNLNGITSENSMKRMLKFSGDNRNVTVKCRQPFKNWCQTYAEIIDLKKGYDVNWDIVP